MPKARFFQELGFSMTYNLIVTWQMLFYQHINFKMRVFLIDFSFSDQFILPG